MAALRGILATLLVVGVAACGDDGVGWNGPPIGDAIEDAAGDVIGDPGSGDSPGDLVPSEVAPDVPSDPICTGVDCNAAQVPVIKVSPESYVFVGSTASVPAYQDFVISNLGAGTLILQSVSFQKPTGAFTLFDSPKAGTEVAPQGTGPGNDSVTFKVRYAAANPPDDNDIVIASNDPVTPKKLVKLKGSLVLGEPVIAWADQVTGCVDFTAVATPGQSCTKVINIANQGQGTLVLQKPTIEPPEATAYSVQWFVGGGTQAEKCGAYDGTEIAPTIGQYALTGSASVDVVVTYAAPGFKGQNASLSVNYTTPYAGTLQVPLCGGMPKGQFDLAPPASDTLYFFSAGEAKPRTFVVVNAGNGPLLVHGIAFAKGDPGDPDGAFSIKTPVSEVTLPPWSLLPVTVEFSPDGVSRPVLNGQFEVSYQDPLTLADQTASLPAVAHNADFGGITLPVASAAVLPANPKAGQQMVLDASASIGGTYPLWNLGYTWFLSAKPAGSLVQLSHPNGAPQVSVTPDLPGTYEFRVYAFSTDDGATAFYFSDEAVLSVTVTP